MATITFVSLGMSCQAAHQLARFAAAEPSRANFAKGPFDWLVCPPENAANWLDQGLCDFRPTDITELREHAYWSRFDIWFWHGFYTKTDHSRVLELAKNAERELSKLDYQRKTFKALDPGKTTFIVANTQNNLAGAVFRKGEEDRYRFSEAAIDRLQSSLDHYFGAPTTLCVATRADLASPGLLRRDQTTALPVEESEWKGDDVSWNIFLDGLSKPY